MIKTIADLHTHTMVSQHAYSTLDEMASAAESSAFQPSESPTTAPACWTVPLPTTFSA